MTSDTRRATVSGVGFRARWAFTPLLVAALVLAISGGCRFATTKIGTIQAKPDDYVTREVTVVGDVTDSIKLPFLPGLYGVNDGTGEMQVLTSMQPPPRGTHVRVRVRVEFAATIGGSTVGLHLKELERY